MNVLKKITIALLVLCFLVGCARRPRVGIEIVSTQPLPKAVLEVLSSSRDVKSFRALADAHITVKGRKRSVGIAIVAELPERIRLEFMDQLAGTTAVIVSKPGWVMHADAEGESIHQSSEYRKVFKKLTRLPWGPAEAIGVLVGSVPVDFSVTGRFPRDSKGRFWLVEWKSSLGWESKPAQKLIYLELEKGRTLAKVEFSEYREENGIKFPTRIHINLARRGTDLLINYKDIDFNVDIKPEIFNVVAGVSAGHK